MDNRPHPEMGFRTCLGIISEYKRYQEKDYTAEHLEMISSIAISKHYYRVKQIKDLLQKHKPAMYDETPSLFALSSHENIRGANYYV
jgi:hypothetical protein